MSFYLVTVYVFLGYFMALLPKKEAGDPWWIEWTMPLFCAIAALFWPMVLIVVYLIAMKLKADGDVNGR